MEEKKREAIEHLENAEYNIEQLLESVRYAMENVKDTETAEELWDELCRLDEIVWEAKSAYVEIEEAFNEADDELEEEMKNEEEEEEEEEENEEE